jgi:hypothetical protein
MLIINKRKKFSLNLETVYFSEDYKNYNTEADIVLFYLSRENTAGARIFHTLRIDLLKSEEQIFSEFSSTTRNRIHKADLKGDFTIRFYETPDLSIIDEFCNNYDEFAGAKGIKPSDKAFILMAQGLNALSISMLSDRNGTVVCGTAEIHDDKTILGMYSFSHFRKVEDSSARNTVSNANRYLYWELIKHYKQLEFTVLDLGGLGMGQETADLDSVDQFKRGFGGKVYTLFHFYHARTFKGKVALWMMQKNSKIEY